MEALVCTWRPRGLLKASLQVFWQPVDCALTAGTGVTWDLMRDITAAVFKTNFFSRG